MSVTNEHHGLEERGQTKGSLCFSRTVFAGGGARATRVSTTLRRGQCRLGSARAALDGSIPSRTAYAQHGVQTHGVLLPCTTMCWSRCGGEGGYGALVLVHLLNAAQENVWESRRRQRNKCHCKRNIVSVFG